MSVSDFEIFKDQQRSNWVRLRTFVRLRWLAIAGQSVAIFVAVNVFDLRINVWFAMLAIGASVLANLLSSHHYPKSKRLSEREATVILVFDILQLSLLLFLTGGLSNPFAMLLLAPVTIAATVLHIKSTVFIGVLTISLITFIGRVSLPIETMDGTVLVLPALFQFGFWDALVIGVIFLTIYARQVTNEMHAMAEALVATQLALVREQKLTDLGGVVAATAHELGTPLATIKLVSSELREELENHPELLEDVNLIGKQADRCRDILHSMGRAGKDDLHLRHVPLEAVVREAAEPHLSRDKDVQFNLGPLDDADPTQPTILRRPEIIHGLRNLIQNAVDFSRSTVDIAVNWSTTEITVVISDDGSGFPASVIGRIGDPYVRRRRMTEEQRQRPGYEGMGLGLFIAKTLLERSGASLTFANSRQDGQANGGAIVNVVWPRTELGEIDSRSPGPLGENTPNDPYVAG